MSYVPKMSRRETLQWLAATSIGFTLPKRAPAETGTLVAFKPTTDGLGTDPNLNHPAVTWHTVMEPHQLQLAAVLADAILPGSETAPAPSAVEVRIL